MPKTAIKIDGTKFMWDKGDYTSEAEAKEKMDKYKKDNFEVGLVKEEGKFLVYTRRIVTQIVVENGGQPS